VSKRGRTNPDAELNATIDAVATSTETACRFPARVQWLYEQGAISQSIANMPCDRYEEWKKKLAPNSVWLVFASYYLNNPASMYGHTFLRLGRGTYEDMPLLDYTANFAAATASKNGLVFAAKGLLGGYPGTFSTHPYYMKVQQYNNLESRDLWEYKLNLTPDETDRLVRHLWELGPTSISYYFLNKNCSYQLLPLLEVARPSLEMSHSFQFRAIPLDTLRIVLAQENLIGDIKYRPSHLTQMLARRDRLTINERRMARSLRVDAQTPRPILESAYDFWRFKNGFKRDMPESAREEERRLLLLLRESSGTVTSETNIPRPVPPESAHGTGRIGVGFGADRYTTFQEFSIRPALHDIEEDPTGYVKGSELEMFSVKGRYNNDRGKAYLENFTFIDIVSLTPHDSWAKSPTWRVRAEIKPAKDLDRRPEHSLIATINGGSGITFGPFSAMVEMDGSASGVFNNGYRAGAGASGSVLLPMKNGLVTHFKAAALRYPMGDVSNVVYFRLAQTIPISKKWMLRLVGERFNHHIEGLATINRYF
jgi:hypothetical protein